MRNANEIALDLLTIALTVARRAAVDYMAYYHLQADPAALEQSVIRRCKAELPKSLHAAAKLSDTGLAAWAEVEFAADMTLAGIQAAQDVTHTRRND